MNEKGLQVFKNTEFGELGVLLIDGKEHFPAAECARMLGYSNPHKAVRDHCKGCTSCSALTTGGEQDKNFIPEGDLFRLIVKAADQSRNVEIKEKAERFERWVFDEVLPSIRKHGVYATDQVIDHILADPEFGIKLLTQVKEERARNAVLEAKIEDDKPKVTFASAVEVSKNSVLIGALAKVLKQNGIDIGQNRLFKWLRENDYLIKGGENKNMPTQTSMDAGLFEVKVSTTENKDGSIRTNRTTKVTGKGQIYFVNLFMQKEEEYRWN